MRAMIGTSVASLLVAGLAIAGVASTANAETARKVSSASSGQYQARYDYVPTTQTRAVQPQAAPQPQPEAATDNSASGNDIYFYHAMGTMSRP